MISSLTKEEDENLVKIERPAPKGEEENIFSPVIKKKYKIFILWGGGQVFSTKILFSSFQEEYISSSFFVRKTKYLLHILYVGANIFNNIFFFFGKIIVFSFLFSGGVILYDIKFSSCYFAEEKTRPPPPRRRRKKKICSSSF